MKKFSVLTLLSIGCAAFLWIAAHLFLCLNAGGWATRFLASHYHAEVHIGKIRTNFFGGFTFRNVDVVTPIALHVPKLSLKVRPPFSLLLASNESDWGDVRVRVRIVPWHGGTWHATVIGDDVKTETLLAGVREKLSSMPDVTGRANLEGTFSGALQKNAPLRDWNLHISSRRLMWQRAESGGKIPLALNVRLDAQRLMIDSLSLRSTIKVKGQVESPFEDPRVHLIVRADHASLPHLLDTLFPSSSHDFFGGSAAFLAKVDGPLNRLRIQGDGSIQPVYAKIAIPSAQGTFLLENGRLSAGADFARGRVELAGTLADTQSNWDFSASGVSLGAIAEANDWKAVGGTIDAHLKVASTVDGSIEINDFRWGRMKAEKPVLGRLNVTDRLIRLNADALNLKVSVRDAIARVEDFRLNFGKDSRIAASGTIDLTKKALNLSLNANNVPPDLWPPLVERYPNITGALDVKGPIKGTWDRMISDCDISFDGLKFLPTGGSWKGDAKLHGSPDEISLKDIRIAAGYSGEVTWTPSKRNGLIKIKAAMERADPLLFFDILKSSAQTAGVVTGQLDLELRDLKPMGTSSLLWTDGQAGGFKFDRLETRARFEPDKIHFEEFSIAQGPRAINGSGEGTFRSNGWDTSGTLQLQRWGSASVYLDGEMQWTGRISWPDLDVNGTIRAPLAWFNDFSVENLQARVRRKAAIWTVDGESNKKLHFQAGFDERKKKVNGTINAVGLRMEELSAKTFSKAANAPKGPLNIAVGFNGPIDYLTIKADLQTTGAEWHRESFDAKVSLRIDPSTITITHAEGRLEKGGTFSVAGALSRTTESSLALSAKGSKLNLQSVFHLLDWPVVWDGKTDATFEMSGPAGERTTRVTFNGKHTGFGPFPLGGEFSGAVSEANRQWDLSGIRVGSGDGYATLLPGSQIYLDKNGSGTMRLLADSRNLRGGVLTIFGGAEATGSWKGHSDLNPTEEHSPIELDIFARSLWLNQYVLEGNVTHLTLKKGELEFSPIFGSDQQLSGKMFYHEYPDIVVKDFRFVDAGVEKCFLEGHVGPEKWDYSLRLKQIDAGLVRGLLDTSVPLTGKMDADLRGKGSTKKPELSGDLALTDGQLDILPIDLAQCKLTYKNGIIDASEIHASRKKGYQLTGRVRFQADGDADKKQPPEIDLTVDKGDLAFVRDVWPEVSKARGTFTARFQMSTKSWGRSVSGFLSAQKISLTSAHTPSVQKGEIKMRLDKNRLHIEEAHAKFGKGTLALTGYVDFQDGLPNFYNLSLRTPTENGISIRVPELSISPGPFLGQFGILKRRLAGSSRGEPLVNLILKGPSENPLLAGTIELENTIFTYPPTASMRIDQTSTALRRWVRDFWERLKLDVSLVAGSRTWYQNELVDANVNGQIHFVGPTGDLDINGRIGTEQGSIVYSGSEFKIKDATLELVTGNPALTDVDSKHIFVYLKADAEKQVYYTDGLSNNNQDVIVMTVDRSLIGEIQPRFYSRYNPNLSPERALQLALGLPLSTTVDNNSLLPDQRASSQNDRAADNDKMLRLGLVQLLDSSLASPLARALARNTGLVDVIRISYQERDDLADNSVPVGDQTSQNNITQNQFLRYAKGTKVKFGRGISSRLFADYSVRVDEYQNQVDLRHEVELSYQLKRNLYLRGISELDNQRQLGRVPDRRAILENQWRFGLPKPKTPQKPLKESKATPARSLYNRAS